VGKTQGPREQSTAQDKIGIINGNDQSTAQDKIGIINGNDRQAPYPRCLPPRNRRLDPFCV